MRYLKYSLVTILIIALIATSAYVPTKVSASVGEVVPNPSLYVFSPRYSAPYPTLPGGVLNVTIYSRLGDVKVVGIELVAPNLTYSVSPKGKYVLTCTYGGKYYVFPIALPKDIKPALYDLIVKVVVNGKEYGLWSPRSVWVLKGWPKELRIVHISDTHLGLFVDGRFAKDRLKTYILLANALKDTDVVIITGDIVDVGSNMNALKLVFQLINQLRKPTYIVPGNHDWAQVNTYDEFMSKYFGVYVGTPHWVRRLGNITLIGLNTGADGYLSPDELSWLNHTLAEVKGTSIYLLFHHPIFFNPGKYVASWSNPTPILKALYSSWREHLKDSLIPFLKLIGTYKGVRAAFAGHIHRDSTALLNGRFWMITATTADAGRPFYRGFRLVNIFANGSVKFILPRGAKLFSYESSFRADDDTIRVNEVTDNELTTFLYHVVTTDKFQLDIKDAPLYFYLNASVAPSKYRLYGNTSLVKDVKVFKYGKYILYEVVIKELRPNEEFTLVISSYKDSKAPNVDISLYTPMKPIAGKQGISVSINAVDSGWGVKEVYLLYKTPTMSKWKYVKALHSGPNTYSAYIPPLSTKELTMKALAIDWAGNKAYSKPVTIEYIIPQKTVSKTSTTKTPATTTTTSRTVTSITRVTTTVVTATTTAVTKTVTKPVVATRTLVTTTKLVKTITLTTTLTQAVKTTAILTKPLVTTAKPLKIVLNQVNPYVPIAIGLIVGIAIAAILYLIVYKKIT